MNNPPTIDMGQLPVRRFRAEQARPFGSPRIRTVARLDAWEAAGGGEVQMTATRRELQALGLDTRPWRPWDAGEVRPGDVTHFFGSCREFQTVVDAMRRRGVRTVLSTIAWFDWRNVWREPVSPARRLAAAARYAARAALPRLPSWRRRLYHSVDLLLPNSQAEAEQLMRLFEVPAKRIRVVPNGVEERFADVSPDLFRRRHGRDEFVLCVGRIEPRKNQLGLIRALHDSGIKLVIIGSPAPGHEQYAKACRLAADDEVSFLGHIDRDDPMLASAYSACRCFALASWYETPSLAALEAALTGAPLVLPAGGCAREYFGPSARYVTPDDRRGIRDAVLSAFDESRSTELAELIRRQFSWRRVAEVTKAAYESL